MIVSSAQTYARAPLEFSLPRRTELVGSGRVGLGAQPELCISSRVSQSTSFAHKINDLTGPPTGALLAPPDGLRATRELKTGRTGSINELECDQWRALVCPLTRLDKPTIGLVRTRDQFHSVLGRPLAHKPRTSRAH